MHKFFTKLIFVLGVAANVFAQTPLGKAPFDATPDQVVTFRLRSPEGGGHARLWWTDGRNRNSVLFTVPGDGDWHDYRLRPCWQAGRVAGLYVTLPRELPKTAVCEVADVRVEEGDACDVDTVSADGIVFSHRDTVQHYATVLLTRAGESGNAQAKFTTMPDGREHSYWLDFRKLYDKKGSIWRGRCTSLSVVRLFTEFPSEVRPLGVKNLRFVKGRPDLPPDPVITGVRPLEAIPRAGRPLVFEVVVRNLGTRPVDGVSFVVDGLPRNVNVRFCNLSGKGATIPPCEGFDAIGCAGSDSKSPGERSLPNERIYRLVADDPGVGTYDVGVTLRAAGVAPRFVRVPVEVKTSLGLPKADYVPEPQPVRTGDFEVGALLFPGWSPEVHRWSAVASRALERKPLLGWYDERQPETIDWQIKHLVENGISYVSVDWYWDNGRQRLNHWMTAFQAARYRRFLKWHLMWANHNEPKSHSDADMRRVTQYWIEHFFNQEEYQKIGGKPVVTIWATWSFENDMGLGGCRRALEIARKVARESGFPGIHFIAMRFPEARTDAAQINRYREMGFDETTVYKYCGFGDPKAERDKEGAFPYRWIADTSLAHWRALKDRGLPFVPNLSTGYDDRPWRGEWGWSTSGINADDFRRICRDARRFGEETGQRRFLLGPIDEWGEGSIAYPNAEHGFGMLEAVRDTFGEKPAAGWPANIAPSDVGRTCPQIPQPNNVQMSVDGGICGKLSLPFADLVLTPTVAFPDWNFFGATSGCEADLDGSRTFGIMPIWDQRVKFAGRLRLAETPEQTVCATYEIVPQKDAKLNVMGLCGTFPFDDYAGGAVETDGMVSALPKEYEGRQAIVGGSFTNVVIRDGRGVVRIGFSSERAFTFLVQDARGWKQKGFSLRFAFPSKEIYRVGETNILSIVVSAPLPLTVMPSVPEILRSSRTWIPLADASPWIEPGSALDFSCIVGAKPTSRLGRVRAVGGHFECDSRPGESRRFYGVNLCTDMGGITDAQIDRFVENLVRTGYNSLRIHHYGDWLTAGSRQTDGVTFDELRARRLDRLMAACARCGVYVTTDLYVSRHAPFSALGIDRPGEVGMGAFKHLVFVHDGAYRNFAAFASNLLCRVNTYTGVRYADDPTLAFVSMLNESSLVSGGTEVLREWPCWQSAWKTWLSRKKLAANPTFAHVSEEIPVTLEGEPTPHRQAFALFLAEMEERFFRRTRKLVREKFGCKALLTNMNGVVYPIVYQRIRAELHDFIDEHYYVDHPSFLGTHRWVPPYTFPNVNPLLGCDAGVPDATIRRIFGKPFTVSEYCYCGPGRFRAISGILTGSIASLQDWSALWHFAWSHGPDGVVRPETTKSVGMFDVSGDPIAQLAERTVSALFLRGDVQVLPRATALRLDRRDLSRTDGPYGLWQTKQAAGFIAAAWRTRIGMSLGRPLAGVEDIGTYPYAGALVPEKVGSSEGATGVVIDDSRGILSVATSLTSAIFAEGGRHHVGSLEVELEDEPAAVSCISIDGQPIEASRRLLVTHLTDAQNTGAVYADARHNILLKPGNLPVLVRAGKAKISVSLAPGAWEVWGLSTTGTRKMLVPSSMDNGRLSFMADVSLCDKSATMAYELVSKP